MQVGRPALFVTPQVMVFVMVGGPHVTAFLCLPSPNKAVQWFLKGDLGQAIFSKDIQILEDPLLPRGDGSRPWDGEALPVQKRHIVENGVLKTWLLNMSSARQLDMTPTGHATRGVGSPPGVSATNTWIAAGTKKIENGARAFPVSEVTIAGNLKNMYKTMIPASDLKMDSATNAPSLLCEGLTLAGS